MDPRSPDRRRALHAGLAGTALLAWPAVRAAGDPATALQAGGVVVLLRHARTEPGIGDPPGFDLAVCASQRQLSAEGREQSRRIGAWFAQRRLQPAAVRSSQWCRSRDTGALAFPTLGVQHWPALDSTFAERAGRAPQQAAEARRALERLRGRPGFEVWVSHMVNVQAIAGVSVSMGEALVVRAAPEGDARGVQVLAQWSPGG